MTSYLIDKLEELKENEKVLKEQQRVLMEEIELDIEKKRRLELDGTIIKLRTQVDEIAKNIEGEIMPNNYTLLREQKTIDYQKACDNFSKDVKQGLIDDDEEKKQRQYLTERQQELFKENSHLQDTKITLDQFKDNLSKVTKEIRDKCYVKNNRQSKNYIEIPREIKIYDDIIPIFSTMIGIMKKQECQIDNLKQKMENLVILKDI